MRLTLVTKPASKTYFAVASKASVHIDTGGAISARAAPALIHIYKTEIQYLVRVHCMQYMWMNN